MSDDMRDRLQPEFAEYDSATMDLSNAFGFIDNPAEWADDPAAHAEIWMDASGAARRVQDAADGLAEAAKRVARDLEDALPDEARP